MLYTAVLPFLLKSSRNCSKKIHSLALKYSFTFVVFLSDNLEPIWVHETHLKGMREIVGC